MKVQNAGFMRLLSQLGVLATEMEASHLFLLALAHSARPALEVRPGRLAATGIQAGCVLGVVGDASPFARAKLQREAVDQAIQIALASPALLDPD
jgi:hypothetical protein